MTNPPSLADFADRDRERDLGLVAAIDMSPSRARLTSLIIGAVRSLHEGLNAHPAVAADLEGIEFARRRLKGLSKRMKGSIRLAESNVSTPPDMTRHINAAQTAARDALDGEPWRVECLLRGATDLNYTARHCHGGLTVAVYATSLAGLIRGVDAVSLDELETPDGEEEEAA